MFGDDPETCELNRGRGAARCSRTSKRALSSTIECHFLDRSSPFRLFQLGLHLMEITSFICAFALQPNSARLVGSPLPSEMSVGRRNASESTVCSRQSNPTSAKAILTKSSRLLLTPVAMIKSSGFSRCTIATLRRRIRAPNPVATNVEIAQG